MSGIKKRKFNIRQMTLCGLFAALIAIGAFIRIPIPVCPFTMQTLFTTLAGLILGRKYGALSVILYIVLGLIGFPIFTEGGGFSYIFKPTFGYIIGFCIGAFITGIIAHKNSAPSFKRLLFASLLGLMVIYIIGMIYFYFMSNLVIENPIGLKTLIIYCFLTTIPGDILSCILSSVVSKRIIPHIRKKY